MWGDNLYSWIGRLDIVKKAIPPKLIYKFNAISIKIPAGFKEINKLILKLTWKCKIPKIPMTI